MLPNILKVIVVGFVNEKSQQGIMIVILLCIVLLTDVILVETLTPIMTYEIDNQLYILQLNLERKEISFDCKNFGIISVPGVLR
jgi:hypothetical protein